MGKSYVLAAVGGGGKTAFLEKMAESACSQGKTAAVMTTTHMWLPETHSGVGKTAAEAVSLMERDGIVYFGALAKQPGKMSFPGTEGYEMLCRKADLVLVEADGSRGLPMKVPDWPREPVIPSNVDAVMVVFGLSALGKPYREVCQRWELGREWLLGGLEEDPVTEELAACFLEKGYLKPLQFCFPSARLAVILNQADSVFREQAGERIRMLLARKNWECMVMQLRKIKVSVIYMASGFGRRFGSNKLLEPFAGKPLYRHGLERFLQCRKRAEQAGKKSRICLQIILASQYAEILEWGENAGIRCVRNPYAAEGITASIRLGVEAADRDTQFYLFSVADQPFLEEATIEGLLAAFLEAVQSGRKSIGCLSAAGRRGNPVIFDCRYREELLSLHGDKGGSQIMKRCPDEVLEYPARAEELEDIDYRIS